MLLFYDYPNIRGGQHVDKCLRIVIVNGSLQTLTNFSL
jgi:hypothetical protein